MNRRFRMASSALVMLLGAGCGDAIYALQPGTGGGPSGGNEPSDGGGGVTTTSTTSAGGDEREPTVDDTGTLVATITVHAYGQEGTAASDTQVSLSVTVLEWETDTPVNDAIVTAGPSSRQGDLEYDVYSLSTYGTLITGYEPAWEFSIVRGDDHLTGVVLLGPSFHAVTAGVEGDAADVAWSPSGEPGVRSTACVINAPPAETTGACGEGHDEGSLVLSPASSGDQVIVERRTKVPVGIAGSGLVDVWMVSSVP